MAFRSVILRSAAQLHARLNQLVVEGAESVAVPLEDIAVLVIEEPRVGLSAGTLSKISEAGVAVVLCDDKHMPCGILTPFSRSSRQLRIARLQLGMTAPLKKRLWQSLIRQKILNQADCLDASGLTGASDVRRYAAEVQSGDTTGREAIAAGVYFRRFMSQRRHGDDPLNHALDYGYTVVRAAVARALVAHGLYPAIGIHHANELNAFNLADDILEPYRPVVDHWAAQCPPSTHTLDANDRAHLLEALHAPCTVRRERHSVLTAIDRTVSSLVRAIQERSHKSLELPSWRQ